MSMETGRVRRWVAGELWESDLEKAMGHQIVRDLEYIEALEKEAMMGGVGKVASIAEAKRNFEEASK